MKKIKKITRGCKYFIYIYIKKRNIYREKKRDLSTIEIRVELIEKRLLFLSKK